jgi:hypothetical protein
VTQPTAGPRCPRCHRPLAAWRLAHCVYCGEAFPAELKAGFTEPEGLKWIERPPLPPDLSKKLELMRVVRSDAPRKSRTVMTIAGIVAVPIFGAIFYLAYTLIRQLSPGTSLLILVAGVGAIGYLASVFFRSRK